MAANKTNTQTGVSKNKAIVNGAKKTNQPATRSLKDKPGSEKPNGKITRRFSLDIQSPQIETPRKMSFDLTEPKSILKNKTRRSSATLEDLPRSTEFEKIMASLLSSKISPCSSTESLHSSSGKTKEGGQDENCSDSGSDRDLVRKGSYRLCSDKDAAMTKKVTFSDNVSCVPSL